MATKLNESGYLSQPRTKILCEKWSKRIDIVEQVKGTSLDLSRKAALAKILENTEGFIRYQLNEATQSSDIGQYKRFALDIITAAMPNLIAYDVVSVQPIENRTGMVNYIKYVYGNTKGSTEASTAFNTGLNKHPSDPNFTSRLIRGEAYGLTGQESKATLQWGPIVPGTIKIKFTDATDTYTGVYTDKNKDGNLWLADAAAATADFKINYTTKEVTYPSSFIGAGDIIDFDYAYNNEYIPMEDIPEIKLEIASVPITTQARRMKAYYSFEASYELTKEYGVDIQKELNAQAAAEIAHEIDIEICNELYTLANAGNELSWSKTLPYGVSMADHYDSFAIKLNEGSAMIHQATRRVSGNFVILGTQAAVIARSVRGFVPSNVTNITGPYFLGTLNGLKLYVNPEYDQWAFVIGFKGDSLLNAGYIYAPYMPIMTTDLVQLEDMAGRKGWATMYGKVMLNDRMYIKGKVTN